jgi:hypothetical protein
MNPKTALARRYYLHVANGGKLTERDVARMVETLEEQDQTIDDLRVRLEDVSDTCKKALEDKAIVDSWAWVFVDLTQEVDDTLGVSQVEGR